MPQLLKLEIDSQLNNTALVAMAVRGVCALTTLSPVEINRLELCLVEVVNNVVEHAYDNESGHPIEVFVELEKTRVNLSVCDWGKSIPEDVMVNRKTMPPDPDNPETWLCSGRGLHIVNRLMDEVSYQTTDGKNHFAMQKALRC